MSGPLPLFLLDIVLLPGGEAGLHVFEPRYRKMIARCLGEPASFGLVRVHDDAIAGIGCEAVIAKLLRRYPDGRMDVRVRGIDRIRLGEISTHPDGYFQAEVSRIEEGPEEIDHSREDRLEERYRVLASIAGDIPPEPPPRGPRWSFRVADRLRLSSVERQALLETMGENERLILVEAHLDLAIEETKRREEAKATIRGNGRIRHA